MTLDKSGNLFLTGGHHRLCFVQREGASGRNEAGRVTRDLSCASQQAVSLPSVEMMPPLALGRGNVMDRCAAWERVALRVALGMPDTVLGVLMVASLVYTVLAVVVLW